MQFCGKIKITHSPKITKTIKTQRSRGQNTIISLYSHLCGIFSPTCLCVCSVRVLFCIRLSVSNSLIDFSSTSWWCCWKAMNRWIFVERFFSLLSLIQWINKRDKWRRCENRACNCQCFSISHLSLRFDFVSFYKLLIIFIISYLIIAEHTKTIIDDIFVPPTNVSPFRWRGDEKKLQENYD